MGINKSQTIFGKLTPRCKTVQEYQTKTACNFPFNSLHYNKLQHIIQS